MEAQPQEEATRRELLEAKSDIEALLKHPGWKRVEEFFHRNIEWRKNKVCFTAIGSKEPDGSIWTTEMSEFMKGELAGMTVVLNVPDQVIENLKFDLAKDEEDGN